MTTLMPEGPAVAVPAAPPHPTACPSWCKDRRDPLAHRFGPSYTAHWSEARLLRAPSGDIVARAQLARIDEGGDFGTEVLNLVGETDDDLTRDEVDILIAEADAWVAALRALRSRMGGAK